MKCKVCGREMTRERKDGTEYIWLCVNPKCPNVGKKEEKEHNGA